MSNFVQEEAGITLFLTQSEAQILINLVEQLLELLGEGDFFHHYDTTNPLAQMLAVPKEIETPEDPVLKRLLPNAYSDPEAASDFRRYTEPEIRGSKQRILRRVRQQLTIVVDYSIDTGIENNPVNGAASISGIDPDIWLLALNDLRLALAVRLDVDGDSYENFDLLPDEDPLKPTFAVYFWLGWLQENLLSVLG
ncbi:MAG: DUF2017 domain-containing protein [Actinomycetes bacterium]